MNRLRRIFDDGTSFPLTEDQPFYAVDNYFLSNQIHNGPRRGKGSDDKEGSEKEDEEEDEEFETGTVDRVRAIGKSEESQRSLREGGAAP